MTIKTALTAIAKHYIKTTYTFCIAFGQVGIAATYGRCLDGDTAPFTIAYAVSLLGLAAFVYDCIKTHNL